MLAALLLVSCESNCFQKKASAYRNAVSAAEKAKSDAELDEIEANLNNEVKIIEEECKTEFDEYYSLYVKNKGLAVNKYGADVVEMYKQIASYKSVKRTKSRLFVKFVK